MAKTEIRGAQILDAGVERADMNITDATGKAVVVKIVAGTNINIGSTGGEAGTGIVTINSTDIITVGTTAPGSPTTGQLWVDTN